MRSVTMSCSFSELPFGCVTRRFRGALTNLEQSACRYVFSHFLGWADHSLPGTHAGAPMGPGPVCRRVSETV